MILGRMGHARRKSLTTNLCCFERPVDWPRYVVCAIRGFLLMANHSTSVAEWANGEVPQRSASRIMRVEVWKGGCAGTETCQVQPRDAPALIQFVAIIVVACDMACRKGRV